MSLPQKQCIAAAYQEYLLTLARAETDHGCERLFGFKGDPPMYFSEVAASWSADERFHLMSARIRLRLEGSIGVPAVLSAQEKSAVARFDWPPTRKWRSADKPLATHVSAITGTGREIDAEKLESVRRVEGIYLGHYKIDRAHFRKELHAAMKANFGKPERQGGGVSRYWTSTGGVRVATDLDFGGRPPSQLRYSQTLWEVGSAGGPIVEAWRAPGICDLLGYPQSELSYVTEDEVPATARLVAREFVEAVPSILRRAAEIQRGSEL